MPIDNLELARRIKTAREASGKTQEQVAVVLGVSRPTVTQIELGNRAVSSIELQQLANLFGRDIREFFKEVFVQDDAVAALFRATPGSEKKGAIESKIKHHLSVARELASLESLLEIQHPFGPPPSYELEAPDSRWTAVVQGRATAEKERSRLELGSAPIADLVDLMYSQGIYVGLSKFADGISGVTLNDHDAGSVVIINGDGHAMARQRFSLAHEFCHVLLDRHSIAMISNSAEHESIIEVRANAFAAAFLMPEIGVRRFFRGLGKDMSGSATTDVFSEEKTVSARVRTESQGQDIQWFEVLLAAAHFGVSRQAMLFQLKNLKIVSEAERAKLDADLDESRIALFKSMRKRSVETMDGEVTNNFLIALGVEALRRNIISMAKLEELAALVDNNNYLDQLLEISGSEVTAKRRKHKGDAR